MSRECFESSRGRLEERWILGEKRDLEQLVSVVPSNVQKDSRVIRNLVGVGTYRSRTSSHWQGYQRERRFREVLQTR